MPAMLLLGFSSGLPLFLTNFTLQQWLSESHVSLRAIGATALVGLPYTLKFLWAPLFDRVRVPLLADIVGVRRAWLLPVQLALMLAIVALGQSDPPHRLAMLASLAAAVAFVSASQDILIDAWRIESFPASRQGAALAVYVWGYRIGMLAANAGAIWLAGRVGWHGAYLAASGLLAIGIAGTLIAPPTQDVARPAHAGVRGAFLDPLADFLRRDGAWAILAFVLLFQLGTAFADSMAAPFYRSLGFDRNAVAIANTVPILLGVFAGSATGGLLVARFGTVRALIGAASLQMVSLLLYVALAMAGPHPWMLQLKVLAESFAEAMASTAFLSYLSGLCSISFTATQYALLSSLAPLAWRTLAGFSGVLAGALGWPRYFVGCALACLPAMLLLAWLNRERA